MINDQQDLQMEPWILQKARIVPIFCDGDLMFLGVRLENRLNAVLS